MDNTDAKNGQLSEIEWELVSILKTYIVHF